MTKNPVVAALEAVRSGIAELDPRGENDTVSLALIIGSIAVERVEKRKKIPGADKLFALAVAEFTKDNGREPNF